MSPRLAVVVAAVALLVLLEPLAGSEPAAPLSALGRMPVKEVTVFKDGHAFVIHAGSMPVDASGNVVLDYLPTPVLGTFWPYSTEKNARLTAATAGQRRVTVERTAMTMRELVEANVGLTATFTEVIASGNTVNVNSYTGLIVGIPTRSAAELEAVALPGTGALLPQKSNLVLVKTDKEIVKVVNLDMVRDVSFKGDPKLPLSQEELRNVLTLKLDWAKKPAKEAEIGMMYVQRGLRWIPSYKINLDGKGSAQVKLEATLINELTDLSDVTANLVIGVPTFDFKDTADPISLQAAMAQLGQYFREDSRNRYAMSNALMSQSSRMTERVADQTGPAPGAQPAPMDLGPEVAGSQKNEDLFVFTVNHITLKKGQRMVLPVTEFVLKYKDVYKLDIPISPPRDVYRTFDNNRQAEIAKLMNAPKAMHIIRLANDSKYPMTTAPALIMRDDKVLAQGMATYTGVGGTLNLPVTAAVDIHLKRSDKEVRRVPNAENWEGHAYNRIELEGTITLSNHRGTPVEIEVSRSIAGIADEAGQDGKAEMLYGLESQDAVAFSGVDYSSYYPSWWSWYGWPYWWNHFNGVGQFTWSPKIEPGKGVELTYKWHYLWR
ncbi:MAG: hypothetical protein PHU85_10145 [Phycisphaerae bacterium]|nr:hypothetical protein [Phycisphaerae bacterium]